MIPQTAPDLLTPPRSTLTTGDVRWLPAWVLFVGVAACGSSSDGPSGDSGVPIGDGGAAGPPTITELAAGDGQSAAVETAVSVAPVMRVLDRDQVPVPGVSVTFEIVEGGGRVDGAEAVTGPDGTASPEAWYLGPTPGRNRLVGEVPGLAPVFFEATGLPDERGSFVIARGDRQTARVGTAVETAPSVRLLDASGAPVVGQSVQFEVGSGGGTVDGGTTVTDDGGEAVVGAWRLGPEAGEQTLVATTEDLPTLTFRAVAIVADAPVLCR